MARVRKAATQADKPVLPNRLIAGARSLQPATGRDVDSTLTNPNASYFNKSLSDVRQAASIPEALKILARVHGDVSAAIGSMVRLANTPLSVRAYDQNHQLSPDGTALARSVLRRMDTPFDYTAGYDDRMAVSGVTESLLKEIPITGACAVELILDQQRLPAMLAPVATGTLKWKVKKRKGSGGQGVYPVQPGGPDGDIALDVPTFFYAAQDQDPATAYPQSGLEPAVNSAPFHGEVVEDIRRVTRRSGHSRLTVKLKFEELRKAAPADVRGDANKMKEWLESVRGAVKDELEGLSPESALVFFDTLDADYLNSEIGASADYRPLVEVVDGIQSTALKTPPGVLGKRMGGSQNTSSTESLLFIKTAGGLQPPVATVLSRALTLAVRLYGFQGYCTVEFAPINLRPDIETTAFKIMRQQLILEQLSLGFLTDQEAAELLGTGPRAQGAPPLSGSMFYKAGGVATPSPNDNPTTRGLVPDAPANAGGRDNQDRN